MTSSRAVAVEVLTRYTGGKGDISDILNKTRIPPQQRGKATDISFEVIRNLALIDMLTENIANVKSERTDKHLRNILRAGIYELVYCPDVADYAIVNEAVEMARERGGKKGAGFVNAVLRNICRAIENRSVETAGYDWTRVIPQDAIMGCLFKKALLCDFRSEPAKYLSQAFSLPQWLTAEWIAEFGFGLTRDICFASNRRCGVYLQPNILKTNAEQLEAKLINEGVDSDDVEIVCNGKTLRFRGNRSIASFKAFSAGLFTVQDPTASKVAEFFNVKPGETAIDLCAAPGGKTVSIAQVMADDGTVIATDSNPERLAMVKQNRDRLGLTCVEIVELAQLEKTLQERDVDAVLVDVPCSNTGVMAKRVEVRWRIRQDVVAKLKVAQLKLLIKAAELVAEGGRICYSTCSIMKAENREIVDEFLAGHKDFEFVKDELTLPSASGEGRVDFDGGYAALLKKTASMR